jgi:hypothetical protein
MNRLPATASVLMSLAVPSLAIADWGENWGAMEWGSNILPAVPGLSAKALVVCLVIAIGVGGVQLRRVLRRAS